MSFWGIVVFKEIINQKRVKNKWVYFTIFSLTLLFLQSLLFVDTVKAEGEPIIISVTPSNMNYWVSLNPTLSANISDSQANLENITFKTNATGSWTRIGYNHTLTNGTYTQTITNMNQYNTTYYWSINITDSEGHWTNNTYKIRTIKKFSWWNSSWEYSKQLNISNPNENRTQIRLKIFKEDGYDDISNSIVDCDGHCNDNFSDIRFASLDATELPYWIEENGTSNGDHWAIVWIKLPSNDGSINVYYGKEDSTSTSNANSTWLWYEEWGTDHTSEYTNKSIETKPGHYICGHYNLTAITCNEIRYITKINFKDWSVRDVDTREPYFGFGMSNSWDNTWYSSDQIAIDFSPSKKNGADAAETILPYRIHVINDDEEQSTEWETMNFSPENWYKAEFTYNSTSVSFDLYNNDRSTRINSHTLEGISTPESLSYNYYVENGDDLWGETYWDYISGENCLKYGSGYYNEIGRGYIYTPWTCIGTYCSSEPTWSNLGDEIHKDYPHLSSPSPTNCSDSVVLNPQLEITISDMNGDLSNITFRTNATGSWTDIGYNSTSNNGTYYQTATNMNTFGTKYYWSINATDSEGHWTNETFYFTTNYQPNITNPNPSNESSETGLNPICNVTVDDADGDLLTVRFYENTTGSWVLQQTTSDVNTSSSSQNVIWNNYSNASSSGETYWWKVNVTDNNGGYNEEIFSFSTGYIANPAPSNNSCNQTLTPVCNVTVSNLGNSNLTVEFYENTTGSWVLQQTNSSINASNPTNIVWNCYTNASQYNTTYWWKVNVSDEEGNCEESVYNFKTNALPTIALAYPSPNGTTDIRMDLACQVWVNDSDGGSLSVCWYENSTGTWTLRNRTSDSAANSLLSYSFNEFSNNLTTYYWKVSANDSINNVSKYYYFTTQENYLPILSGLSPSNSSEDVSLELSSLSLTIYDYNNDTLNWTIQTSPDIGSSSGTNNNSTSITCSVSGLSEETTYYWFVNVSDGTDWTNRTYHFETEEDESNNNDGDTPGGSSSAFFPPPPQQNSEENQTTTNQVEEMFNISLEEEFYATDENQDGANDTLNDPNNILSLVRYITLDGHPSFLISVNDNLNDLFLWDTIDDEIYLVTYNIGSNSEPIIDEENDTITINLTIQKNNWVYIQTNDPYPNNPNLVVTNQNHEEISSSRIWRENNKIYILDDPTVVYYLIYTSQNFLFDVELTLTPTTSTNEENITAIINLINVGETGLVNATLEHIIKKDNMTIWTQTDNISIAGSKTYTKNIHTENFESGTYTYTVTHYYGDDQSAKAETEFTINQNTKPEENKSDNTAIYVIICVISILIFIIILFKTKILYFEKKK